MNASKEVLLSDVIVEDRLREDLGDLASLADSMKEHGQLQPIVVNKDMHLVAGGRRHAAATLLGWTHIYAVVLDKTNVSDIELELVENIARKDFTWAERAIGVGKLRDYYRSIGEDFTIRTMAKIMERSVGGIHRILEMSDLLAVHPDLAKCKTENDAFAVIKAAKRLTVVEELRSRKPSSEGNASDENQNVLLAEAEASYIVGDFFERSSHEKYDLIECDPPYGIDYDKNNKVVDKHTDYFEIPKMRYKQFLDELAAELWKSAADDCWVIFWSAFEWLPSVKKSLEKVGFRVRPTPCLWVKSSGGAAAVDDWPANAHEFFLLAKKGKPLIVQQGHLDVWKGNHQEGARWHITGKPLSLLLSIFETFSLPSQKLLVPFLGSGVSLIAAKEHGLEAVGFDKSNTFKDHFIYDYVLHFGVERVSPLESLPSVEAKHVS